MKVSELTIPKTDNKIALISIAHGDDLALFCGGTVIKLVKAGWCVYVVRATDDRWDSFNISENKTIATNDNEFKTSMDYFGVNRIFNLGLNTDQLGDYSEVKLRGIYIDLIRDLKPYLVITFDPYSHRYEDNEDHKLVASAMAEAMWAAGFDKHPGNKKEKIEPHLPVQKWFFGRDVASPTHFLNVTSVINKLAVATAIHKTMLENMARQWWLKGITAGISLDHFLDEVKADASIFATWIIKESRQKKVPQAKYSEIYRVIDDSTIVNKLTEI